jgi:TonB-dependent receptor
LESINVIKTFTPDQPGDFTGGSVDLRTRNIPDKPSFGAGVTVEYNSQATFNPNFLSYQGGGTGPFGFQADKRKIPASVTSQPAGTFGDPTQLRFPTGLEEADKETTLMRDMNPVLSLNKKTVGPNYKLNLQGGDVVEFEDDRKFGLFGMFSYNKEYTFYDNGTRTQLYREPFVVDTGYTQQRGTEDVLWGTLLNLSGQLDANHKVSSNFIFNEQASDTATASQMTKAPTDSPNRTSTTVIDYGERQLAFMQITGDSVFPEAGHLKLNWNGGLGRAQLIEPDQRAFQSVTTPDGTQRPLDPQEGARGYAYFGELSPAFRYQRDLTENSFYTIADFLVPMDANDQYDNTFKTGFYYDQSDRSYNQDSYNYKYGLSNDPDYLTSQPNIPGQTWSDYFLSPDRSGLVNPTGQGNGQLMSWTLFDTAGDTGTFYDAYQAVTASYIMTSFKLFPQLKLSGGARFENTNIQIKGSDDLPGSLFPGFTGLSKIQQLDLLPAVGATFELAKDINLRFSWAQTLARPSFKEMGPVLTQDFGESTYFVGNPFLKLSSVNNYDFRAEWFTRPGEVISLGLFYKEIDAPIEQTVFGEANTGTFLKYVNSDLGQLWGWEVEFRKRLDQLHVTLKNFSIFFNFTQIQSQVTLSEQQIEVRNDSGIPGDTRPLQGQPTYVLNTGLNYDNPEYMFYSGIYFNVSGEFLYAAGGGTEPGLALPDVYEQPFPSLDFNLTQGLTENWKMTFRGKNLLNPFYRLTQTLNGTEYDTYTYTKGWDISLNLSYGF